MGDFDLKDSAGKTGNDRLVVHILYGLHTLAWFSAGVFALVALIINYLRRADESEPMYLAHHRYMIATYVFEFLGAEHHDHDQQDDQPMPNGK